MQTLPTIELPTGKVHFKDHFHSVFYGNGVWKCALIASVLIFLMLIGTHILSGEPVSVQVFLAVIYPTVVAFIMILFWTFLLTSLQFKRLSSEQRNISWQFSNVGIGVSDKAGNKITTPWTQVKTVKFNPKGVCIYCKPFGTR